MSDNPVGVIVTVLVIGIVLLAGFQIIDAVGQQTDTEPSRVDVAQPLDGDSWVAIGDGHGTNETVVTSRGYALQLNGANDSYIRSDQEVDVASDDTWTVCTWVQVRDTAQTMTALSVDGRVLLGYNGTEGNWTGWYYDDGSSSSWRLSTNATNETDRFHQLCLWHDDTNELRLYVNATQEDSVADTSADNIEDAPVEGSNWNGSLEETRTFDDPLNQSQLSATVNQPNDPLANATRTARIMYDAGGGDTVHIWWSGAKATVSNGTWVDGFDGEELSRAGMLGGDYEWRSEGPQIRPTSDSTIADAPVVYVTYDRSSTSVTVMEDVAGALELANVLMVVLIAGIVITLLRLRAGGV